MLPSLDKSTYGFCGHKCRMALRGSSAGASLPSSPRFPLQHFCRAKTPQDFSARENQMMARKRTPAYWRMPRTMTQSALICTAEKRVCPCQAKVLPFIIAGYGAFCNDFLRHAPFTLPLPGISPWEVLLIIRFAVGFTAPLRRHGQWVPVRAAGAAAQPPMRASPAYPRFAGIACGAILTIRKAPPKNKAFPHTKSPSLDGKDFGLLFGS